MAAMFHQDRFIAPLQDMTDAFMTTIKALGVDAVQLAHASRQVGPGCLEKQVIVVAHQAVGMTYPFETVDDLAKKLKERDAVRPGEENILFRVAPARNVIDGSFKFDTKRTCHSLDLPPKHEYMWSLLTTCKFGLPVFRKGIYGRQKYFTKIAG